MIFSNITARTATTAHFKITVMLKFFLTSQPKPLPLEAFHVFVCAKPPKLFNGYINSREYTSRAYSIFSCFSRITIKFNNNLTH